MDTTKNNAAARSNPVDTDGNNAEFLNKRGWTFIVIGIIAFIIGLLVDVSGIWISGCAAITSGCYLLVKGKQQLHARQ